MALQIFLSRSTFGKTSFQKVVDKAVYILIDGRVGFRSPHERERS